MASWQTTNHSNAVQLPSIFKITGLGFQGCLTGQPSALLIRIKLTSVWLLLSTVCSCAGGWRLWLWCGCSGGDQGARLGCPLGQRRRHVRCPGSPQGGHRIGHTRPVHLLSCSHNCTKDKADAEILPIVALGARALLIYGLNLFYGALYLQCELSECFKGRRHDNTT